MTWFVDPAKRDWRCAPAPPGALAFHSAMPRYAVTPLTELPPLAAELGVGRVFVKDDSTRLGLSAFKILGVSWAVNCVHSDIVGEAPQPSMEHLGHLATRIGSPDLVTATDGSDIGN